MRSPRGVAVCPGACQRDRKQSSVLALFFCRDRPLPRELPRGRSRGIPPTPDDAQLWRDAQQQFVKGAPNRDLVTAERSSHDIAGDRPDVIVAAVTQMLKSVG